MKVYFDLPSIYYFPQYSPVLHECLSRGHECALVVYNDDTKNDAIGEFLKKNDFPFSVFRVNSEEEALNLYEQYNPDWIVFGNDNVSDLSLLPAGSNTALLYHGIGVKACYYDKRLSFFDVRFTEGNYRQEQLSDLYPGANFQEVGFAKLDPLVNPEKFDFRPFDLAENGLSDSKKTILYAPTFYPSSIECMPKNWPSILADYNVIIKPHFISTTNSKYKKQRELIELWSREENVYVAGPSEQSLLPFMAAADLLISEASSALFEFAALDKPVIWLDFLKLRWSYRGIFKYRFERRMDKTILQYRNVAAHVGKPRDLFSMVEDQLQNAGEYSAERNKTTQELIGRLDGAVSQRICDYMENYVH